MTAEREAMMEEFFTLCEIVITENDDEVIFWTDENYEYAKALLKEIKEVKQ